VSHWDYKPFYRCRLPHWQPAEVPIFLTWRLAGSLPKPVLEALAAERAALERDLRWQDVNTDWGITQYKRWFGKWDRGLHQSDVGPRWLARQEIAECVQQVLHDYGQTFYTLHVYTLMPNHVHLLLTPGKNAETDAPFPLSVIVQRIKGVSSRKANVLLGRTGQSFWSRERYDHWIRNPQEFERAAAYIVENPVKAGLVEDWQAWPWTWIAGDLLA